MCFYLVWLYTRLRAKLAVYLLKITHSGIKVSIHMASPVSRVASFVWLEFRLRTRVRVSKIRARVG